MRTKLAIAMVFLAATSLFATVSSQYSQFGKGPEQWLMSKDEQGQWRKINNDQAAEEFIQLFWARRDPSPGTVRNEFREEFEARVTYADREYRSKRTRGALTDMGRVYLTLGPPLESRDLGRDVEGKGFQSGAVSREGAKQQFTYADAIKLNLTGPVSFVENAWGEYKLDFQKAGIAGALSTAVRKAIVNPELREVPNWARAAAPETQAGAEVVVQKVVDVEMTPKVVVAPESVGATNLTLLKDVFSLQPQSGQDPLQDVSAISAFTKADELGWAAQYCGNSETVKVTMNIDGTIGGKKLSMISPTEEMSPDSIKAHPGCYLIRGAIPLEEMDSGDYKLTLLIEDPSNNATYKLQQDFRVN